MKVTVKRIFKGFVALSLVMALLFSFNGMNLVLASNPSKHSQEIETSRFGGVIPAAIAEAEIPLSDVINEVFLTEENVEMFGVSFSYGGQEIENINRDGVIPAGMTEAEIPLSDELNEVFLTEENKEMFGVSFSYDSYEAVDGYDSSIMPFHTLSFNWTLGGNAILREASRFTTDPGGRFVVNNIQRIQSGPSSISVGVFNHNTGRYTWVPVTSNPQRNIVININARGLYSFAVRNASNTTVTFHSSSFTVHQ